MYKKLLLIDDDEDEQFFFSEALKCISVPVKFLSAATAREGIRLMKFLMPDIVFLDYNMPRLSGLDCLKIIQRNKCINHIPVLVYSTVVNETVFDAAVKNGAATCIKKQGTIEELACLLENFLVRVKINDLKNYNTTPFV